MVLVVLHGESLGILHVHSMYCCIYRSRAHIAHDAHQVIIINLKRWEAQIESVSRQRNVNLIIKLQISLGFTMLESKSLV